MIEIQLEGVPSQISWYAFHDKELLGFGHGFVTEENARKVAIKFLVNWFDVQDANKLGL